MHCLNKSSYPIPVRLWHLYKLIRLLLKNWKCSNNLCFIIWSSYSVTPYFYLYSIYMNIKNLLLTFAFPSKAILLSLKSSFRLILSMSVSLEISKCFLFANCFSPPDHFLCFWGYFCIWIVVVISWGGHSSWVKPITVTGNRPVETIPWTSHMVRTVYVWFVHYSFWIVTPIHIYIDF